MEYSETVGKAEWGYLKKGWQNPGQAPGLDPPPTAVCLKIFGIGWKK
jgi:hypothetical protein